MFLFYISYQTNWMRHLITMYLDKTRGMSVFSRTNQQCRTTGCDTIPALGHCRANEMLVQKFHWKKESYFLLSLLAKWHILYNDFSQINVWEEFNHSRIKRLFKINFARMNEYALWQGDYNTIRHTGGCGQVRKLLWINTRAHTTRTTSICVSNCAQKVFNFNTMYYAEFSFVLTMKM